MDGVLVHENQAIRGAGELIRQWTDQGKPFLVSEIEQKIAELCS